MNDKIAIIEIKYFENSYGEKQEPIEKIEKGDWIDLRCNENITIEAGQLGFIRLGVGMRLPEGYEAHIAPRSSTFKKWGILQANSVGVVDNSYAGDADEWMMPVYSPAGSVIKRGDRVCQFRIIEKQPEIEFREVSHLDDISRGGFGSTGTN